MDDEPAISGSKEVANQTGTITHDKLDNRAHDEATIITKLTLHRYRRSSTRSWDTKAAVK